MKEINTMVEWMNELSNAIESRDRKRIGKLETLSNDWIQSEDEKNSQLKLLQSASKLVGCVDSLECELEEYYEEG